MTRPALDALSQAAVAKMRWAVFARALKGTVQADIEGQIQTLADIDKPPSASELKTRRSVDREAKTQALVVQAALRKVLLLDDDEAES